MKKNLSWLWISLPLSILFTLAFLMSYWGEHGDLSAFFEKKQIGAPIYSRLQSFSGWVQDLKFRFRGPRKAQNKIVILSVDTESIHQFGRWPWHRDTIAKVIDQAGNFGAKVIGADLIAPEPDLRIPPALHQELKQKRLEPLAEKYETDPALIRTIRKWSDSLVMGMADTRQLCRPAYEPDACPIHDRGYTQAIAKGGLGRFAIALVEAPSSFDLKKTALAIGGEPIFNFPEIQAALKHIGSFDAELDADGVLRRTTLFYFGGEVAFPSFALELASLALNDDDVRVRINEQNQLEGLTFVRSEKSIPLNTLGQMEINFRGPNVFPYLSIADLLGPDPLATITLDRKAGLPFECKTCQKSIGNPTTQSYTIDKKELLQDSIAIMGLTAPRYDVDALPFDPNAPGVLSHAMALDNILAGDPMIPLSVGQGLKGMLLMLSLGVLAFGAIIMELPAAPAIVFSLAVIVGFAFFDYRVLFLRQKDWNTGFFYLEYLTVAILILLDKYLLEENQRKFLKQAFSRFVSPKVVQVILKDPEKLALSGTKKELSILFSDIRNFMPLCLRLDAHALHAFLNDYHDLVSRVVIETGTLDKYIGDNVMAFWGAPLDQADHAYLACEAALKILAALKVKNLELQKKYGITIGIGIGVNTGPVIVGNMGSQQVFSYTAIGDDVNLASRIERLTRYYGVNILTTRATIEAIRKSGKPLPPHRSLDRVRVIGGNQAVEVVQIIENPIPAEALDLYQKANLLYQERRWAEAIAQFQAAGQTIRRSANTEDKSCDVLIQQCRKFQNAPPPPDWDGSWEMATK